MVAVLMKHLEESHKLMEDEAEIDEEIQKELDDEAARMHECKVAALAGEHVSIFLPTCSKG